MIPEIDFHEPGLSEELGRSHPTLHAVLADLMYVWPRKPMVMSVERLPGEAGKMGDKSPHVARPCRAVDIRTKDVSRLQVMNAASFINRWWVYDPERPLKVVALVEFDPPHLHVQVHDRTALRAPWMAARPEMA